MQVQSASVSFQTQHQFQRQQSVKPLNNTPHLLADKKNISVSPESTLRTNTAFDEINADATLLMIKTILERFLGREIVIGWPSSTDRSNPQASPSPQRSQVFGPDSFEQDLQEAAPPPAEMVRFSFREQEKSEFSVRADVVLSSGERREIVLEQTMVRKLSQELTLTALEASQLIDPLVINFNGPVELSTDKVNFDLNADGHTDSFAGFASNSAYIALDKNGDGVINDGSELFGALTGDGFAELAAYDEDGNGFIDAHDSVFSRLQLFRPDSSRTQSMQSRGVEALSLMKTATPFQLLDDNNDVAGQVRTSGFYLTGTGAGSLQQIDLVI